MISTSPSSLAASLAPLAAASKKPLPRFFTRRAILVAAEAGLAARVSATAVLIANAFRNFMVSFLPWVITRRIRRLDGDSGASGGFRRRHTPPLLSPHHQGTPAESIKFPRK